MVSVDHCGKKTDPLCTMSPRCFTARARGSEGNRHDREVSVGCLAHEGVEYGAYEGTVARCWPPEGMDGEGCLRVVDGEGRKTWVVRADRLHGWDHGVAEARGDEGDEGLGAAGCDQGLWREVVERQSASLEPLRGRVFDVRDKRS